MIFTDSHAHLSFVAREKGEDALAALLSEYGAAAAAAALTGGAAPLILDPGTEPADLPDRAALLARLSPAREGAGTERGRTELGRAGRLPSFLRLAAGVWPSPENLSSPAASMAALEAAIAAYCAPRDAAQPGLIAAVGEGGLDYHYAEGLEGGLKSRQAELFEAQLSLASRLGLPMIVHSRDAAADTLGLLRRLGPSRPVLIHCFGYGPEEARAFLDLGCFISFAGNLSYKKNEALREACALVPPERLLLETDAPYMNPMPERGKPSSPGDVPRTYACAALVRKVDAEELSETVSLNAHRLFG